MSARRMRVIEQDRIDAKTVGKWNIVLLKRYYDAEGSYSIMIYNEGDFRTPDFITIHSDTSKDFDFVKKAFDAIDEKQANLYAETYRSLQQEKKQLADKELVFRRSIIGQNTQES